jgi:hypothetical protein
MPFSSLSDPVEVARAHAALERAWAEIKASGQPLLGSDLSERSRLVAMVAGSVLFAQDEDELVERVVQRFLDGPDRGREPRAVMRSGSEVG